MRNTPTTKPKLRALIGETFQYQPNEKPYDPALDDEPGTLIIGSGMHGTVVEVFEDWNGVDGLTILYVTCNETGMSAHFSPREFQNPKVERATTTGRLKP